MVLILIHLVHVCHHLPHYPSLPSELSECIRRSHQTTCSQIHCYPTLNLAFDHLAPLKRPSFLLPPTGTSSLTQRQMLQLSFSICRKPLTSDGIFHTRASSILFLMSLVHSTSGSPVICPIDNNVWCWRATHPHQQTSLLEFHRAQS